MKLPTASLTPLGRVALLALAFVVGGVTMNAVTAGADPTKTQAAGFDADDDGDEVLNATCAAAGTQLDDADGNAQNPTGQVYYVTCLVEPCFVCDAATCAAPDGLLFPVGSLIPYRPDVAGPYACRSVGSAGVFRMSPGLN